MNGREEQREMLWQYSLPVGHMRLTLPPQPLSPEEVDDMEAFLELVIKQLRRAALRETKVTT